MKLTPACLDDLQALMDLEASARLDYADQSALADLRRDFLNTYGMTWNTAREAASKYARQWQRRRV